MARENKYRGESIDDGKWVYGDLLQDQFICNSYTILGEFIQAHAVEVDPETVGEYTGEHDINKNKIYGGDIVKRESGLEGDEYDGFIGVVKFVEAAFVIESLDGKDGTALGDDVAEIEIIGNIHDKNKIWGEHFKNRFERMV